MDRNALRPGRKGDPRELDDTGDSQRARIADKCDLVEIYTK
jgi:hypothetical protein